MCLYCFKQLFVYFTQFGSHFLCLNLNEIRDKVLLMPIQFLYGKHYIADIPVFNINTQTNPSGGRDERLCPGSVVIPPLH